MDELLCRRMFGVHLTRFWPPIQRLLESVECTIHLLACSFPRLPIASLCPVTAYAHMMDELPALPD